MELRKREFKALRVSLTSQCNLSCYYCVAHDNRQYNKIVQNDWKLLGKRIILLDQILKLRKIRFTGGEPTLYPHLLELITYIKNNSSTPLYLTTNGILLKNILKNISHDTFKHINLSIDALNPEIYYQITHSYGLDMVLDAFYYGIQQGFHFNINTVVLNNINTNQIVPIATWAKSFGVTIRFIEFMNMGIHYNKSSDLFFSNQKVLNILKDQFSLKELPREPHATAYYYHDPENWKVGFISNQSHPFCSDCDRLRMDANGKLYGCITQKIGFNFPENINDSNYWNNLLKQKQEKFNGSPIPMIIMGG